MHLETLTENEIICTLIALALLLLGAYACGNLFEKMKAPRVVGEILGGMFFGGSCMYMFFPDVINAIFSGYEAEGKVLNIFYQLGLIFLMFLSGYNTNIDVDKKNGKIITFVLVGSTVLPMLGAIPFIPMFMGHYIGALNNEISFGIVFTIGVAITSIPVISKIFFDMGVMNTTFANTILTVATLQDLLLWILLNAATRIATTGEVKALDMVVVVVITLGLFGVVKVISEHAKSMKRSIKAIDFYSVCIVVLLFIAATLSLMGINIMYSAFLVGYVVKAIVGFDNETRAKMRAFGDIAFSFFIPIYFALVGIQLNVVNEFSFMRFAVFFVIAFGLEAIGTLIMVQFTNLTRASKINFAITMNARGGPGIVLATVAYGAGIINLEFFTVLILTTMLSSLIAGYWLRRQQKIDEQVFVKLTK